MVTVQLPEDLAAEIDSVSKDRSGFVAKAVRQALREAASPRLAEEISRINAVADELNSEASKVLEYQVIR
jgi:metal-responsive CopG/Arc/MetJ family transcriptional regulator